MPGAPSSTNSRTPPKSHTPPPTQNLNSKDVHRPRLIRLQNKGHDHFITFSCFRHRPNLGTPQSRGIFLQLLEQLRLSYKFKVIGYVIMPDHVHLLLSEPETKPLSSAIQVLKQTFSRTRPELEVWESRYYDFNVYTAAKRAEKLSYIHLNPVRRGLVTDPAHWLWSSYHLYNTNKTHVVQAVP